MVRIMGKLPIDRLEHCVTFVADVDDAFKIVVRQAVQCSEEAAPALLPFRHHQRARPEGIVEFRIAITPCFLAIGGEEVGPPRPHIPP